MDVESSIRQNHHLTFRNRDQTVIVRMSAGRPVGLAIHGINQQPRRWHIEQEHLRAPWSGAQRVGWNELSNMVRGALRASMF